MKEKLIFENSKGNKLVGILSDPEKRNIVVVLVHGIFSSKESKTYKSFEKLFNERGIATFRFDLFGHNESDGELEDITVSEAIDDVEQAITFMKKLGYFKIGLIGASFAGLASAIVASKNDNLFALGLRCPVSNMYETLMKRKESGELTFDDSKKTFTYQSDKRVVTFKQSLLKDAKKHDALKVAHRIQIPTILEQGDRDLSVSLEETRKLASKIYGSKLEVFKGADHHFKDQEEKSYKILIDFFLKELKQ